jgi:hypothetical protein
MIFGNFLSFYFSLYHYTLTLLVSTCMPHVTYKSHCTYAPDVGAL